MTRAPTALSSRNPPVRRAHADPALVAPALAIALLALLPLLGLFWDALQSGRGVDAGLGFDGPEQIRGTLLLVLGEGVLGAVVGTGVGWLTAVCRFPGRRWLRSAQLLPMAFPAYLLAASLIDWGSRHGFRIHGMGWAVLLLTLANYSYVFLLSTESFSAGGRQLLDASLSLGLGPWASFRRIALPIALPAIGAGVALSGMEVVNELGAVRLLGVPSLSAGILDRWQIDGDPQGASLLALVALAIVAVLIAAEQLLRRRSRRWNLEGDGEAGTVWPLSGWRASLAQLVTALPPLLTLAIPALWIGERWSSLRAEPLGELLALSGRSLLLALVATGATSLGALLLAILRRWRPRTPMRQLSFLAGLGYGVPGSVLGLGLLIVGAPLLISPLVLMVWGYVVRFLTVSKQGVEAALERIPPSIDESALSLGHGWGSVLRRVHLPLLSSPLLVGGLLVFVDVVKELPLTLALRPLNFDTLAVRLYQYASDERIEAAMGPALVIMALGLLASAALIPRLDRRGGH